MDRRGPVLFQLFTHAQSSPSQWNEGDSADEVCNVLPKFAHKIARVLDWRSLRIS